MCQRDPLELNRSEDFVNKLNDTSCQSEREREGRKGRKRKYQIEDMNGRKRDE